MIQQTYYIALFLLSFALTIWYVILWRPRFDTHLSAIFVMVPIANLAYMLLYLARDRDTAIALLKVTYASGCFLPWLSTMCVMNLCRIRVKHPARVATLLCSAAIYLSVLTVGRSPLFYKSLTLGRLSDGWVLVKEYGPLHTVHYVLIVLYLIANMAAIWHTYRKKKQVSRRILFLLVLPIPVSIAGYFAGHALMPTGFELMPLSYLFSQVLYLLIARRLQLYNVSEMVIESMVQAGETGFITVDAKGRYLGSNATARRILPELRSLTVDRPVANGDELRGTVISWLDRFQKNPADDKSLFVRPDPDDDDGQRYYSVDVNDLYDGQKKCGWQIFLQDDTEKQKYIALLDRYNADLQAEVDAKTERLVVMHDRFILGLASMVESRDNSTGGHIRRTSEGVRILIETAKENGALTLSDTFCKNIIKAAPMHDLGKIAVDDAILRKPGRFTPEEFEKMKAHAAEGARIVREILRDTDDEDFRRIAENVAHYHHERMDGSGYPDGLKGTQIPLEARIMAIADVYDALVSKRVYKDAFSFEKANTIILEGMGPQFDPALKETYVSARPKLEAYYSTL